MDALSTHVVVRNSFWDIDVCAEVDSAEFMGRVRSFSDSWVHHYKPSVDEKDDCECLSQSTNCDESSSPLLTFASDPSEDMTFASDLSEEDDSEDIEVCSLGSDEETQDESVAAPPGVWSGENSTSWDQSLQYCVAFVPVHNLSDQCATESNQRPSRSTRRRRARATKRMPGWNQWSPQAQAEFMQQRAGMMWCQQPQFASTVNETLKTPVDESVVSQASLVGEDSVDESAVSQTPSEMPTAKPVRRSWADMSDDEDDNESEDTTRETTIHHPEAVQACQSHRATGVFVVYAASGAVAMPVSVATRQ